MITCLRNKRAYGKRSELILLLDCPQRQFDLCSILVLIRYRRPGIRHHEGRRPVLDQAAEQRQQHLSPGNRRQGQPDSELHTEIYR